VILDLAFALRSFEGRVAAAGVTTIFHGIGFEEDGAYDRTVAQAVGMCDVIAARSEGARPMVDHRVLHRLDVRDADGLAALLERLDRIERVDGGDHLPLVSYEDHTPGQGQYRDRTWFERWIVGSRSVSEDVARREVDTIIAERDQLLAVREQAVLALGERAQAGSIRLMAHDPADEVDIAEAFDAGMSIAEFPTTIAAARAARSRGMRTVAGAPNALRGTSHSGNVSARELVSAGLCDGLASDYLPSTLLGAAAAMVADGTCDLPTAIHLVTRGPALTVGLLDRGEIAVGARGDLALVEFEGRLPTVRSTISQAAAVAVAGTVAPLDSGGDRAQSIDR
jgi:alpha-D-ribose 1-methylphosphonate 5-triphosphate diphosphatase